ncbi:MAG: GNAT family N-acetyltransferase [Methylococcales bacterium]
MSEATLHLIGANWKPTLRGLRDVQEFVAETKRLRSRGEKHFPPIEFGLADSLHGAIECAFKAPDKSIVLACGYPTSAIRAEVSDRENGVIPAIISSPPPGTERYHRPTSSLFGQRRITRLESLGEGARKAALRFAAKRLGTLRPIVDATEFESFFSLRYRVWKDMGYLSSERGLDRDAWEIDYFDRFSIPIGLFSPDNQLLACARLVRQYGCENPPLVRTIAKLIERRDLKQAASAFSFPETAEQPFDVLCEFRGFWVYFREFVRDRLSIAEVSRVIVTPELRGRGLAEVMVDSLVSLAKQERIDVLMLACRETLGPLYERCGFKPVPKLVSDKFITIPQKSIVMECTL